MATIGGIFKQATEQSGLVGEVRWFAGAAPNGWVLCDNSDFTKEQYPRLFGLCQNKFGAVGGAAKLPPQSSQFPELTDIRAFVKY